MKYLLALLLVFTTLTHHANADICSRTSEIKYAILSSLKMSDCKLITKTELEKIKHLNISGITATSIDKNDLTDLINLSTLMLSGGNFKTLPSDLLRDLKALEVLYITNGNLDSLSKVFFSGLKNISTIDLSSNKIKNFHKELFQNLPSLKTLYFDYNKIKNLPNELFYGTENLELISMIYNQINKINYNHFKKLHKLTYLSLYGNKIKTIEVDAFSDLTSLQELYLLDNQITQLYSGTFKNNKNLERLNLDSNPIDQFDDHLFSSLQSIFDLSFVEVPLTTDPKNALANIPHPNKMMILGFSGLHTIPDYYFSDLGFTNLLQINLVGDKLSLISKNALSGLTEVVNSTIHAPLLSSISSELYSNQKKLLSVEIQGSLNSIPADLFKDNLLLERVDFSNNLLTNIDEISLFTGLKQLMEVGLAGNKFSNATKSRLSLFFKSLTVNANL